MQNFTRRTSKLNSHDSYVFYPRDFGKMAKIDLHHRSGGYNYFNGTSEKRGIEISVSMIEVEESGTPGCKVESFMPMDKCNARHLILEVRAYNKRRLEKMAEAIDNDMPKLAESWEQDVSAGKAMLVEISRRALKAA